MYRITRPSAALRAAMNPLLGLRLGRLTYRIMDHYVASDEQLYGRMAIASATPIRLISAWVRMPG